MRSPYIWLILFFCFFITACDGTPATPPRSTIPTAAASPIAPEAQASLPQSPKGIQPSIVAICPGYVGNACTTELAFGMQAALIGALNSTGYQPTTAEQGQWVSVLTFHEVKGSSGTMCVTTQVAMNIAHSGCVTATSSTQPFIGLFPQFQQQLTKMFEQQKVRERAAPAPPK